MSLLVIHLQEPAYIYSVISSALIMILLIVIFFMNRQIHKLSHIIERATDDISVIKNRLERLDVGDINRDDAKKVSKKMTPDYDF